MVKYISLIAAALLAGFVGGILGTLVVRIREQPHSAQLVRARSFEMVDEAGKVISYWGIDKGGNAVLAFGSHWPVLPAGADSGHPSLGLEDPDGQRAAIGVIDDSAFLKFRGADGKTRVRLYLSMYAKPFLLMEDETGPRVSLGVEQSDTPGPQDNDWTLDFGPDSRARIGMFTEKDRGQTYVRGIFSVKEGKIKYPYQQQK